VSASDLYFGTPGALEVFPHPRGGVQSTRTRPSNTFLTAPGGAHVAQTLEGKRQFQLDWEQLWYETYAAIEAYHHGHMGPGPFVLHDPGRTNWLTTNQSGATSQRDTSNFTVSGSGSSLDSSSSVVLRGPRSLAWNFTYASSGLLVLDPATATWPGIPVIADQAICFSFQAEGAGSDATMSLTPQLVWLDATGATLSTTSGTPIVTSSSAWTQGSVTASPPASAAYVLCKVAATDASGGSILYLDEFQLERGSAPTDWRPGTGVFPVTIMSFGELWPWQASDYRRGAAMVLQEVGSP